MLANFSEVEFLKTVSKFRKRERKSSASFTSSTKRKIRHFHVVIVQRQQRNAKKRVMYVQSCCFVDLNILSFCRSRCRRRCRCLSPVLLVGITASVRLSIQIPECGKSLLVESENLGFGIRNSTQESVIPVTIGI